MCFILFILYIVSYSRLLLGAFYSFSTYNPNVPILLLYQITQTNSSDESNNLAINLVLILI